MDNRNLRFLLIKPMLLMVILISLITLACSGSAPTTTSETQVENFSYSIRVLKEGTNQNIPNAKVTIEVAEQAPLDEITDSNGLARITINTSYAGKPGRLLVEANGYEAHRQEIDLTKGNLPDTISLKPASNEPASPTPLQSTPTEDIMDPKNWTGKAGKKVL